MDDIEPGTPPPRRRTKPKTGRAVAFAVLLVVAITAMLVAAFRRRDRDTRFALYAGVHNLIAAQTAYYMDHTTYATNLADRYRPTHGTSIRLLAASDTSWSATVTHPRTSKVCSVNYVHRRGATKNEMTAARNEAMLGYVCK